MAQTKVPLSQLDPEVATKTEVATATAAAVAVASALSAHQSAPDPYPQYLTAAEGAAAFDPLGAASAVAGALNDLQTAPDPYAQYAKADGSRGQVTASFARGGTLAIATGEARWYPPRDVTLTSFDAWVSTSPTGADLIAKVMKNGVEAATITIGAGQAKVMGAVSIALTMDDYLTINITQVGSVVAGKDLSIRLKGA